MKAFNINAKKPLCSIVSCIIQRKIEIRYNYKILSILFLGTWWISLIFGVRNNFRSLMEVMDSLLRKMHNDRNTIGTAHEYKRMLDAPGVMQCWHTYNYYPWNSRLASPAMLTLCCDLWENSVGNQISKFLFLSRPVGFLVGSWGFPGGTRGKEPACNCRRRKRHGLNPWVGKIPCRRAQQPTPVFLPGEALGQRSLVGYSSQGRNESDRTEVTCTYLLLLRKGSDWKPT